VAGTVTGISLAVIARFIWIECDNFLLVMSCSLKEIKEFGYILIGFDISAL
jgi:hypothetical protein